MCDDKDRFIECFKESTSLSDLGRRFFGWKRIYNTSQKDRVLSCIEKYGLDPSALEKQKCDSLYNTYKCAYCGAEFTVLKSADKRRGKTTECAHFCSRECANKSRTGNSRDENTKAKISKSLQKFAVEHRQPTTKTFVCEICGKICSYGKNAPYKAKRRTCSSEECRKKLRLLINAELRQKYPDKVGGYREGSFKWKGGFYKGIKCESTYELAYVIYCLDNDIRIERCSSSYTYEYDGKEHRYHPDFIVNGNDIVEIKGYSPNKTLIQAKAAACNATVLFGNDILHCFEWVKTHYGISYRVDKGGKIDSSKFAQLYDKQ